MIKKPSLVALKAAQLFCCLFLALNKEVADYEQIPWIQCYSILNASPKTF